MTEPFSTLPMFFYGTLQDSELLSLVLGRTELGALDLIEAKLEGHVVERVAGEAFPIVLAAPGRLAPGLLVDGLSADDRARIAYYEDADYALLEAFVQAQGERRRAVYFAPTEMLRSSGEPWSLAQLPAPEKALLLACTEELMSYYGVEPPEAVDARWNEIRTRAEARLGLRLS